MTFKELLLAVLIPLIVGIVGGIVIVHYQGFIDSWHSSTSNKETSTTSPTKTENNQIEANISVPPPVRPIEQAPVLSESEPLISSEVLPAETVTPPPERILPDDLVTQLKRLQNPSNASFGVELWFNQPGQTRFRNAQKVTINYEVKGLKKTGYLTLLNVSPAGKISMIFSEKVQKSKYFKKVNRITLNETGEEYFKAIVTTGPIEWQTFIAAATRGEERVSAWGTTALIVEVN